MTNKANATSECKRAEALKLENANLRRAILNYWGTCNPPMNEAQKRCEDALRAALSDHEGD